MRVPVAVLAGAILVAPGLLAPGAVFAQSTTVTPAVPHNPNAFQNWSYEQNAATPNGRIYPGDIYGPSPIIVQGMAPQAAAPARMPQYSTTAIPGAEIRDPQVVAQVQQELNRRGYNVAVTGIPTTDTRNALINYQANTGIHPSGSIDVATLSAMNIQGSVASTEGMPQPRGQMNMGQMNMGQMNMGPMNMDRSLGRMGPPSPPGSPGTGGGNMPR